MILFKEELNQNLPNYKLKWVKEKELKVLENDTLVSTLNAEDAVEKHITFKTEDVVIADSQMPKLENTTGLKKQLKDKALDLEKWNIWEKLPDERAMDSDSALLLNPNREKICNCHGIFNWIDILWWDWSWLNIELV